MQERTGQMKKKCAGCRKESCDGCSLNPGSRIDSIKDREALFPAGFEADEGTGYGIAFDVGTTTVAGILVDLGKGTVLEAKTCINPQRVAGSDVISRIAYCGESDENRRRLQRLIIEKLDELAEELWEKTADTVPVSRVMIAGNTAMCEILLGCELNGLARAPFHKDYKGCVSAKGSDLLFEYLKDAFVTVLPAVNGYVGADALSVCACVGRCDRRRNILTVDIGTNGEILLTGKEKTYACSAAAGPALEGAAVSMGMGAAAGAIEEVRILGSFPRQDISCKVIGDGRAKGICGSGLVDALAVLRKLKAIDETGCLLSAKEARREGVPEKICRRITEKGEENRILLTASDDPVYLTAGDIRQLQLAKGALRAGIEMLLMREGLTKEELNHIYLAGAFGSYIKTESAVSIGLLPDIPSEKITQAGNLAGTGAVMALLSQETIRDMEEMAEKICHVELAGEKEFQALFLKYMNL